MPTEDHRMVRLLLRDGKAKVVKRTPFTIRLLVTTHVYKQPVILGVDAGSKSIGLSVSTKTRELFAAEVKPRNDVVKNLSTRREFRRARRSRKTRYRAPRFNNRVHSKHKGWLAPSVEVKIQEHITSILRVSKFLPLSKVVVETAEFDLQLIKAMQDGKPLPQGEDYQKGEMLGHYNVRQYVLWRDGYKCQHCGAHGDGVKLHVHHLESRKTGGNAPDNLISLCEHCHEELHQGNIKEKNLRIRKRSATRDAAFMGIMRKTLIQRLRTKIDIPVLETRGYITKYTREQLIKLPKSHTNDALAIAQGMSGFNIQGSTRIAEAKKIYIIRPVRHHNRQLHRAKILKGGIRKKNQAPTYVKGFRLFDKVRYNGRDCFIFGRRNSGYFDVRTIHGKKLSASVSFQKLLLKERSSNYIVA